MELGFACGCLDVREKDRERRRRLFHGCRAPRPTGRAAVPRAICSLRSDQVDGIGGVSNRLRRLAEYAYEASAHTLPVTEPIGACDGLHWQASLLEHQASRFQAKVFNGLRWGHARFEAEHPTELARAQAGRLSQFFHRQALGQIASRGLERLLNPIGFGVDVQESRVLGLATRSPMVNDQCPCCFARLLGSYVAFDQSQREVDSRCHSRRCPDIAITHEQPIDLDTRFGKPRLQLRTVYLLFYHLLSI